MATFPARPPVPGVDNAPEQTLRLRLIEDEHPEWAIAYDREFRVWRAFKRLPNGEDNITRHDLKDVLDAVVQHIAAEEKEKEATEAP